MKFGHNLPRNQVPEWAATYINYKGLKKLIKTAAEASKDGSAPDLAGKFNHSRSASPKSAITLSVSTPRSTSCLPLLFGDQGQQSWAACY